jgi:2-polyprenyl-6-methoxyphenol hydroxylase-like FAD-dependent oxidoreductase
MFPMSTAKSYDLLIVGGGLAGATLGRSMALDGRSVLIIEKSTAFRDRIRGEVLLPWGGAEAMDLGIYDLLLKACGQDLPRAYIVRNGAARPPREFGTSTPRGNGIMSFYHPVMQEVLLNEAKRCGCEVWRGAAVSSLEVGVRRRASVETDAGPIEVEARLVVAADGRDSQAATHLGFRRDRDPPHLFSGGLQLKGDIATDRALYFYQNGAAGRGAIFVSNSPGNYRAYVFHHVDALKRRWSGERDYASAQAHLTEVGAPREWIEALTPHGVHATFDGAHQWIASPYRDGCVLVGDAAGARDPVWGCGLSRTLRDVRLLRDRLLSDEDWDKAAAAYASDHDDFFHRLRRAEHLNATLFFTMGDAGDAIRTRAFDLLQRHPELAPDTAGLGPETICNDMSETALLGFVQWRGASAHPVRVS